MTGMIVSVGIGGTMRRPTASNPPVTPASISVIGSASMTVKWAKDSGRIR
jgi:hypothetical protein